MCEYFHQAQDTCKNVRVRANARSVSKETRTRVRGVLLKVNQRCDLANW